MTQLLSVKNVVKLFKEQCGSPIDSKQGFQNFRAYFMREAAVETKVKQGLLTVEGAKKHLSALDSLWKKAACEVSPTKAFPQFSEELDSDIQCDNDCNQQNPGEFETHLRQQWLDETYPCFCN